MHSMRAFRSARYGKDAAVAVVRAGDRMLLREHGVSLAPTGSKFCRPRACPERRAGAGRKLRCSLSEARRELPVCLASRSSGRLGGFASGVRPRAAKHYSFGTGNGTGWATLFAIGVADGEARNLSSVPPRSAWRSVSADPRDQPRRRHGAHRAVHARAWARLGEAGDGSRKPARRVSRSAGRPSRAHRKGVAGSCPGRSAAG